MIAEDIREGLEAMSSVERWIDNDIDAGDEAIEIHQAALGRARERFEAAQEKALALAVDGAS